jgi:hypothetical protein
MACVGGCFFKLVLEIIISGIITRTHMASSSTTTAYNPPTAATASSATSGSSSSVRPSVTLTNPQIYSTLTSGVMPSQTSALIQQVAACVNVTGTLSTSNLLSYATEVAQYTENIPGLSSTDKQNVAVGALNTLIENSSLSATEKQFLQSLVSTMVPTLISAICAAAKGKLNINKVATAVAQDVEKSCGCF